MLDTGSMGLKFHPVIQSIPLNDRRVMEALQAFARFHKPVLNHAGISNYYLGAEKSRNVPEFGSIKYVEAMIKTFANIRFIVGHSGLFQSSEVMKRLKGCGNAWFDTSLQSPGKIRKLLRTFGEDKIMFASDWPYGNRLPAIRAVQAACRGDRRIEEHILWSNARDLPGLDV